MTTAKSSPSSPSSPSVTDSGAHCGHRGRLRSQPRHAQSALTPRARYGVAREPFGFNWTHRIAARAPMEVLHAERARRQPGGTDPAAAPPAATPSRPSTRAASSLYSCFRLLSLCTLLPEERGTVPSSPTFASTRSPHPAATFDTATDFRKSPSMTATRRTRTYFCVRLSWNGEHIHQLCDPNDPTAAARRAWCARRSRSSSTTSSAPTSSTGKTRAVTLTLPLRSNHLAVRSRVTLMVEQTATGAVLPSYDIETRVESSAKLAATRFYVEHRAHGVLRLRRARAARGVQGGPRRLLHRPVEHDGLGQLWHLLPDVDHAARRPLCSIDAGGRRDRDQPLCLDTWATATTGS